MIYKNIGLSTSELRKKLVEYSQTSIQYSQTYIIKYYKGNQYFNIDLNNIEINANNRTEAVIKMNDYFNNHLDTQRSFDRYECEGEDIEYNIEDYTNNYFDNDTLWLELKVNPIVIL